jgi:hypothetical protein
MSCMATSTHTMVVELSHEVFVSFMRWLFHEATTSFSPCSLSPPHHQKSYVMLHGTTYETADIYQCTLRVVYGLVSAPDQTTQQRGALARTSVLLPAASFSFSSVWALQKFNSFRVGSVCTGSGSLRGVRACVGPILFFSSPFLFDRVGVLLRTSKYL